jgi:hypothetical protein
MKKLLCAGLAAASICTASPKPAEAGGGGFVFGTLLGLGVGSVVGSAVARPYPYGYYPYGYYPYGYYPYAVPYAYAYPPPVGYAVPPVSYAPPGYPVSLPAAPPSAGLANSIPSGTPRPPTVGIPTCRPGQFFNTLTGNCDRR